MRACGVCVRACVRTCLCVGECACVCSYPALQPIGEATFYRNKPKHRVHRSYSAKTIVMTLIYIAEKDSFDLQLNGAPANLSMELTGLH
jgi:hypothetical protein